MFFKTCFSLHNWGFFVGLNSTIYIGPKRSWDAPKRNTVHPKLSYIVECSDSWLGHFVSFKMAPEEIEWTQGASQQIRRFWAGQIFWIYSYKQSWKPQAVSFVQGWDNGEAGAYADDVVRRKHTGNCIPMSSQYPLIAAAGATLLNHIWDGKGDFCGDEETQALEFVYSNLCLYK